MSDWLTRHLRRIGMSNIVRDDYPDGSRRWWFDHPEHGRCHVLMDAADGIEGSRQVLRDLEDGLIWKDSDL